MKSPVRFLDEYVMQRAAAEPVSVRANLYLALATVATNTKKARELQALARELKAIDRRHDRLQLEFRDLDC